MEVVRLIETVNHCDFFSVLLMLFLLAFLSIYYYAPVNLLMIEFYLCGGSGAQYIPRHEIQKLENCAATLLMGCSSGSLSLNGQYTPQGTHLSYLSAGSPVIVANLWEVTDKDIDRFGKAMLDAWLRERSSPSVACAQCRLVPELKSMSITRGKGDAKKKIPRKKVSKACSSVVCED